MCQFGSHASGRASAFMILSQSHSLVWIILAGLGSGALVFMTTPGPCDSSAWATVHLSGVSQNSGEPW